MSYAQTAARKNLSLTVAFADKPMNLADVRAVATYAEADDMQVVTIAEVVTLAAAEYDALIQNFFQPCAWMAGKGGSGCLRVEAPGRHPLVVNPEGYDYARSVALV